MTTPDRFDDYVSRLGLSPGTARGFIAYTTDSFRGEDGTRGGYIGGLADRIKGLITAFLIAVATDRIFIADWTRPFPLEPILQPARWDWRPTTWFEYMKVPDAILLLHMIGRSNELDAYDVEGIEEHVLRRIEVVHFNLNGFSSGLASRLFPESSPWTTFRRAFETLFELHVPPPFKAMWEGIDQTRRTKGLVGVHLRTGAGNGWEDPVLADWREHAPLLRFAFEEAAKRGYGDAAFYFASDNKQAKEAVRATDWGHTVICSDAPIRHIDRAFKGNRASFDYAIVEFMLLSTCDLVVGGPGGFWSAAALVGGREAIGYEVREPAQEPVSST